MTRGKQKIEAQKRNAERNQKGKGSQLEARAVGLKVICPICKLFQQLLKVNGFVDDAKGLDYLLVSFLCIDCFTFKLHSLSDEKINPAQLANQNQLVDHYASKHPKEKPPAESS
ncbi:hypothetical protein D0Y65_001603 [Glycine soja]|uniref:Small EDRK-rich factor-like N-terminal domain-containing protein n=1 Tax=Glycine soja TaxID=3848 RepID=A0A445M3I4_GLYSO|nr:hypothetical protein D0Y65_001603 [Glycine soja]